jgi:hypothetical protein
MNARTQDRVEGLTDLSMGGFSDLCKREGIRGLVGTSGQSYTTSAFEKAMFLGTGVRVVGERLECWSSNIGGRYLMATLEILR